MSDETNVILPAKLYLCATPIGNMGDITVRVLETLKAAEVIFCEDTRNSGAMLSKLGIKKPLESCHEHNEAAAAERVMSLVRSGKPVAYVSDAGMPCISDPGERLGFAVLSAERHESGHFVFGDFDFPASEVGQSDVADEIFAFVFPGCFRGHVRFPYR